MASSQLNVGDIAFPFRKIFNGWKDFYFRMAYIESVDPTRKILRTTAGEVEYDYLILATGCVPNFSVSTRSSGKRWPCRTSPTR